MNPIIRKFPGPVFAAAVGLAAMNGCTEAPAAVDAAPAAPEVKVNVAERVAMTARPAIVQIYSGCVGTFAFNDAQIRLSNLAAGSGFFIHGDGYVMTNAHVVSRTKDGDQACAVGMVERAAVELHGVEGRSAQEWFNILAANGRFTEQKRIALVQLQTGKMLPFEIKEYGAPLGEGKDMMVGKDVAVVKIELKNAPTLALGDSTKVKVGDRVWVVGYPSTADLEGALDAKSALQPTTTQGAITSTKATTDGAPVLGTDAAAAHGNSGGPALDENGNVIGLLTFGKNNTESFCYLVASQTAKEFVPHAAADAKGNQVDTLYQEGLEHYWAGQYADAKRKFKRVLDLQPEHPEAPGLISEINEKHGDEADEPPATKPAKKPAKQATTQPLVIGAIIAGALVTGFVGLVLLLATRRRRRTVAPVAQPQVIGGYPPAPAPMAGYPAAPVAPAQHPALAATQVGPGVARVGAKTMVYEGPAGGMAAKLTCTAGPLKGRVFPIGMGIIIGRDPARAQIVVEDAAVSGSHLWVGPMNGAIVAMDCGSTNGTFLNDRYQYRLNQAALGNGDVVTIGQPHVKFALVA